MIQGVLYWLKRSAPVRQKCGQVHAVDGTVTVDVTGDGIKAATIVGGGADATVLVGAVCQKSRAADVTQDAVIREVVGLNILLVPDGTGIGTSTIAVVNLTTVEDDERATTSDCVVQYAVAPC